MLGVPGICNIAKKPALKDLSDWFLSQKELSAASAEEQTTKVLAGEDGVDDCTLPAATAQTVCVGSAVGPVGVSSLATHGHFEYQDTERAPECRGALPPKVFCITARPTRCSGPDDFACFGDIMCAHHLNVMAWNYTLPTYRSPKQKPI